MTGSIRDLCGAWTYEEWGSRLSAFAAKGSGHLDDSGTCLLVASYVLMLVLGILIGRTVWSCSFAYEKITGYVRRNTHVPEENVNEANVVHGTVNRPRLIKRRRLSPPEKAPSVYFDRKGWSQHFHFNKDMPESVQSKETDSTEAVSDMHEFGNISERTDLLHRGR